VIKRIQSYLNHNVSTAPLAVFRILFGLMMLAGTIRFWMKGWIEENYLNTNFQFKYFGFEWVHYINEPVLYSLFVAMGISALFISLGLFYRISSILFFIFFTWIELLDKSYYLNHYYFISLVAFLMIFLPAGKRASLDIVFGLTKPQFQASRWIVNSLKWQLSIVYIFAGIAKLNHDWLFRAMPLKMWLPAKTDLFLIGPLLDKTWVAYLFSWFGAFYDLSIPLWLSIRKLLVPAYLTVIVFHLLTAALFPIGMFPYIMIVSTTLFFPSAWHEKIINRIESLLNFKIEGNQASPLNKLALKSIIALFLITQLVLPWRHMLYPGDVYWNERGYRFSWRVMLMEKSAYANFYLQDEQGNVLEVDNDMFLNPFQEKMMATQADMIWEFGNFVKSYYEKQYQKDLKVFNRTFVSINGNRSVQYTDESIDLSSVPRDEYFKILLDEENERFLLSYD